MEIAGRVFRDEDDDSQSNGLENGSIFIGRKACVIDAVIGDTPVDFAPIRPDRKQQHAGFPQVLHQARKDRPLLVLRQMKETVPPDETAEALRQIARPHVAEPPVTGRRFKSRNGQHRRIGVDAGNPKAASGDKGGDEAVAFGKLDNAVGEEHACQGKYTGTRGGNSIPGWHGNQNAPQ